MSYSEPELQQKTNTELRRMVTHDHPEMRDGGITAFMTKAECISVLMGHSDPASARQVVLNRMGGKGNPTVSRIVEEEEAEVEEVPHDLPAEGVAGDHPPEDDKPNFTLESVMRDNGIDDAEIAEGIYKARLKAFKQTQQKKRELAEAAKRQAVGAVRIEGATDKTVDICGITMPIMGHDLAMCAKLDTKFVPEAWACGVLVGATKYEQDIRHFALLLRAGWTQMLVGPRGCGKTASVDFVSAKCQWGIIRVQGNKDMTVADFVGTMQAGDGKTFFVEGPLVRAMRAGYILQLDEVDRFPPDCTDVLHAVMEGNATGKLVITINGGEVITPHPNFRIVATANTAGFGDDTGLHPNSRVQDAAFIDRFSAMLHVQYPERELEESILCWRLGLQNHPPKVRLAKLPDANLLDRETVKLMTRVAEDTRKAAKEQNMLYPLSTRQLLNWTSGAQIIGFDAAFATAVICKVPPQDQTVLSEIAQRHLGQKLGGATQTTTPDPVAATA